MLSTQPISARQRHHRDQAWGSIPGGAGIPLQWAGPPAWDTAMPFTSRQIVTSSWVLVVACTTIVFGKITAPSHMSKTGTASRPVIVDIASAAVQEDRARTNPLPDPVSRVTSETAPARHDPSNRTSWRLPAPTAMLRRANVEPPAWRVDPRSFLLETSAALRLKQLPRANKAELVIEPKNDSPMRLLEQPSHVTRDDGHCSTAVATRPGLR